MCVRNHEDNYFFDKRSMQEWRMLQFSLILSCRRWFEVILWRIYIMLCHVSDPNLELIAFILNEQLTQDIPETSSVSRSDDVFVIVLG